MQIKQYKADILRQIRTFQDYWNEEHQKDPSGYPLDLTPEEWDDLFAQWRKEIPQVGSIVPVRNSQGRFTKAY